LRRFARALDDEPSLLNLSNEFVGFSFRVRQISARVGSNMRSVYRGRAEPGVAAAFAIGCRLAHWKISVRLNL
jgi:hypothetical protein